MKKEAKRKLVPILGALVVFSTIGYLLYLLFDSVSNNEPNKKKTVQQITIIAPPPPPPPPPPEVEEPPPEVEEVEVEEPEPTPEDLPDLPPDDVPPGEQLGLDADGTGGGDAFGLVGKKGGRGLLSGGDPYAWYSRSIQQSIFEVLNEKHDIRRNAYSIVLGIWIDETGIVERFEFVRGSGSDQLDQKIAKAIDGIQRLEEPVPGLPMPIKVKLTARL